MKKFFLISGLLTVLGASLVPTGAPGDTLLAKKGDQIDGTLLQTLNSKINHDGDSFSMSEKNTLFHHNAALNGATIVGHVENVTSAGPVHKATMSLIFDDIRLPDGTTVPIQAVVSSVQPPTHHIRDAGLVLGGAVVGHMARSHSHGGLAGGAAGFALATTLKSDIDVKAGTVVKMKLARDLVELPAGSSS